MTIEKNKVKSTEVPVYLYDPRTPLEAIDKWHEEKRPPINQQNNGEPEPTQRWTPGISGK